MSNAGSPGGGNRNLGELGELYVSIRAKEDKLESDLAKIEKKLSKRFDSLSGSFGKILKNLAKDLGGLLGEGGTITVDVRQIGRASSKLEDAAKKLERPVDRIHDDMMRMAETLMEVKNVAEKFSAFSIGIDASEFGKDIREAISAATSDITSILNPAIRELASIPEIVGNSATDVQKSIIAGGEEAAQRVRDAFAAIDTSDVKINVNMGEVAQFAAEMERAVDVISSSSFGLDTSGIDAEGFRTTMDMIGNSISDLMPGVDALAEIQSGLKEIASAGGNVDTSPLLRTVEDVFGLVKQVTDVVSTIDPRSVDTGSLSEAAAEQAKATKERERNNTESSIRALADSAQKAIDRIKGDIARGSVEQRPGLGGDVGTINSVLDDLTRMARNVEPEFRDMIDRIIMLIGSQVQTLGKEGVGMSAGRAFKADKVLFDGPIDPRIIANAIESAITSRASLESLLGKSPESMTEQDNREADRLTATLSSATDILSRLVSGSLTREARGDSLSSAQLSAVRQAIEVLTSIRGLEPLGIGFNSEGGVTRGNRPAPPPSAPPSPPSDSPKTPATEQVVEEQKQQATVLGMVTGGLLNFVDAIGKTSIGIGDFFNAMSQAESGYEEIRALAAELARQERDLGEDSDINAIAALTKALADAIQQKFDAIEDPDARQVESRKIDKIVREEGDRVKNEPGESASSKQVGAAIDGLLDLAFIRTAEVAKMTAGEYVGNFVKNLAALASGSAKQVAQSVYGGLTNAASVFGKVAGRAFFAGFVLGLAGIAAAIAAAVFAFKAVRLVVTMGIRIGKALVLGVYKAISAGVGLISKAISATMRTSFRVAASAVKSSAAILESALIKPGRDMVNGLLAPLESIAGKVKDAITKDLGETVRALSSIAIKASDEDKRLVRAFTVFEKNAQLAKDVIEELDRSMASRAFGEGVIEELAEQLLRAGFVARDLPTVMNAIADGAAGTETGEAGLRKIVALFAELKETGSVTNESLRELERYGVRVMDILEMAFGIPARRVFEMINRGSISANAAIIALAGGLSGQFGGAAEKASLRLNGIINRLSNIKDIFAEDIGASIRDIATVSLGGLVDWMEGEDKSAGINDVLKNVDEYVTNTLKSFGEWIKNTNIIAKSLEFMRNLLVQLGNSFMNTVVPAVKSAAGWIAMAVGKVREFYSFLVNIAGGSQRLLQIVSDIAARWLVSQLAIGSFSKILSSLTTPMGALLAAVIGIGKGFQIALQGTSAGRLLAAIDTLKRTMMEIIETLLPQFKNGVDDISKFLKEMFSVNNISAFFATIAEGMATFARWILFIIKNFSLIFEEVAGKVKAFGMLIYNTLATVFTNLAELFGESLRVAIATAMNELAKRSGIAKALGMDFESQLGRARLRETEKRAEVGKTALALGERDTDKSRRDFMSENAARWTKFIESQRDLESKDPKIRERGQKQLNELEVAYQAHLDDLEKQFATQTRDWYKAIIEKLEIEKASEIEKGRDTTDIDKSIDKWQSKIEQLQMEDGRSGIGRAFNDGAARIGDAIDGFVDAAGNAFGGEDEGSAFGDALKQFLMQEENRRKRQAEEAERLQREQMARNAGRPPGAAPPPDNDRRAEWTDPVLREIRDKRSRKPNQRETELLDERERQRRIELERRGVLPRTDAEKERDKKQEEDFRNKLDATDNLGRPIMNEKQKQREINKRERFRDKAAKINMAVEERGTRKDLGRNRQNRGFLRDAERNRRSGRLGFDTVGSQVTQTSSLDLNRSMQEFFNNRKGIDPQVAATNRVTEAIKEMSDKLGNNLNAVGE